MGTSYKATAEIPREHSVGLPTIAPRGMNFVIFIFGMRLVFIVVRHTQTCLNLPVIMRGICRFSIGLVAEAYFGTYQTSVIELFCEKSEYLKIVNHFWKIAPSQMFARVLNTPLLC